MELKEEEQESLGLEMKEINEAFEKFVSIVMPKLINRREGQLALQRFEEGLHWLHNGMINRYSKSPIIRN